MDNIENNQEKGLESADQGWGGHVWKNVQRIGAGVRDAAYAVGHYLTHTPIPSELDGLLTEDEMKMVSDLYYKDMKGDYETPTTINVAGYEMRSRVNPAVHTIGHYGHSFDAILAIIDMHTTLDRSTLTPAQNFALRTYILDKFCFAPGA